MDCSLSTWPSLTQFDDLSWIKLGDIDPLENLDQTLDQEPVLNGDSQERKHPLSSCTMPVNTSPDFYSLSPCESLVAGRWESINSLDLATVLDSSFPPVDNSSNSTALDGFDLCDNENLIQCGGQQGGNHVDVFMADTPSVLVEVNAPNLGPGSEVSQSSTLLTPGVSSLSNIDNVTHTSDGVSSIPLNGTRTVAPLLNRHGCKVEVPDMYDSRGTPNVTSGHSFNSFQTSHGNLTGRANSSNLSQPALEVKDMMLFPQHKYTLAHDTTVPWPQSNLTSLKATTSNAEKVVRHGFPIQTAHLATYDRSVELASVASVVSSELKCSRAEASRARRRAASQRRAKRYPLQKLIRMSSLSSNARDKLDQSEVTFATAVQSQLPMVAQSQFPAQSLATTVNGQMTTYLPVVLQAPPLTQSFPHANSDKAGQFDCYQQQLSVAPVEDNQISPGSSAVQAMCVERNMPSATAVHCVPLSQTATMTSTMPLDAALLEQLQSALNKMSVETRLCIRDALYRLARNAKQRHTQDGVASGPDASTSKSEGVETQTNSIDRWIVNILFCKESKIEALNTSHPSQQWDSCGSSMNLQESCAGAP